tara:strand:- start:31 stop:420 length:390 start_codon:yes stop_codon:yes gene_type:complete
MANTTLQFPRNSYPSLQVGDVGYYAILESGTTAGFQINDTQEQFVEIGKVKSIDHSTSLTDGTLTTSVTFDMAESVAPPTSSNFIFFSKDNTVNCSSLVGYYGLVRFKNSSDEKAEMFSVACEVSESSK